MRSTNALKSTSIMRASMFQRMRKLICNELSLSSLSFSPSSLFLSGCGCVSLSLKLTKLCTSIPNFSSAPWCTGPKSQQQWQKPGWSNRRHIKHEIYGKQINTPVHVRHKTRHTSANLHFSPLAPHQRESKASGCCRQRWSQQLTETPTNYQNNPLHYRCQQRNVEA